MSRDTPLLQLTRVHKDFVSGESLVRALDDINLSIWDGEFVAIMGQSGSGKSTLMNILGCLDQASGGEYRVAGQETRSLSQDALAGLRSETFGFIFQRYNLLATSTAMENIEIPAIYAGVKKIERLRRALALLQTLGLEDRASHRPWQLSGGQQQRVAVARALMNNPAVILADEPTGALDSKSGADLMALLEKLNQEGRTIILITHDEQVARHAKRVIRLRDGQVIEDSGSPAQMTADAVKYISASIQDKQANPTSRVATTKPFGILAEIAEAAKMALRALQVNLFRTLLTLLGIIIGVASVVTMMAVGDGSKQDVLDQMTKMG